MGVDALRNLTTASNNTAVGFEAGKSVTTAYESVFIGREAGKNITTAQHQVCIGFQAGNTGVTGAGLIMIGKLADTSGTNVNDETCIGHNITGKGANTAFIKGACYQGNNSSTWSTTSDQRLKKNIVDNNEGLDVINQIKVRNFEYRLPQEVTELPQHTVIKKKGIQLGVIAQELQEVCPDCVKQESTGVLSVNTDDIFWHMVNAIKQLKAEVDSLKAQLNK